MSRASKLMTYLIGLLVMALGIILFLYVQQIKEENHQYRKFLNHFYASVDRSLEDVQSLVEQKPENERLDHRIRALDRDLLKTNTILQSGSAFLNHKIYHTSFFTEADYFLYGLKINGSVNAEIPPLGQDGKLNPKEITLLKTIEGDLKDAKQEMYSPETKQENPNLTIIQFNEIIKKNFSKDASGIYKDAFR